MRLYNLLAFSLSIVCGSRFAINRTRRKNNTGLHSFAVKSSYPFVGE
jgi:hypothetical protein